MHDLARPVFQRAPLQLMASSSLFARARAIAERLRGAAAEAIATVPRHNAAALSPLEGSAIFPADKTSLSSRGTVPPALSSRTFAAIGFRFL